MSSEFNDDAMERAVLGEALASSESCAKVTLRATVDCFASIGHKLVFSSLQELHSAGKSTDVLSVADRMAKRNSLMHLAGGHDYLDGLVVAAFGSGALEDHLTILEGLGIRRRLLYAATELQQKTARLDVPVESILADSLKAVSSIVPTSRKKWDPDAVMVEMLENLDAAQNGRGFVPSGIAVWDQRLGGLKPGVMTFVGAQPRIGKSAVLATMLDATSMMGHRPGYLSLEDRSSMLSMRLLSKYSGVAALKLDRGTTSKYEKDKIDQSLDLVRKSLGGMVVDDMSFPKPETVCARFREMVLNEGCKWLALDHLGKLDTDNKFRHDLGVESALNQFTALVKELNVPLVVLAHTKESSADSQYLRPDLLSFAQTSFIARDARVAVGLSWDKDDDSVIRCSVLKETMGGGDGEFHFNRIKESGMVER